MHTRTGRQDIWRSGCELLTLGASGVVSSTPGTLLPAGQGARLTLLMPCLRFELLQLKGWHMLASGHKEQPPLIQLRENWLNMVERLLSYSWGTVNAFGLKANLSCRHVVKLRVSQVGLLLNLQLTQAVCSPSDPSEKACSMKVRGNMLVVRVGFQLA